MQIKEVKISNLLSFPYHKNIEDASAIGFFANGGFEGSKILIGNNAAGKSNFITIIEEFFSTLIYDFNYDITCLQKNISSCQETIIQVKNTTTKIYPNLQNSNQTSTILINIELSPHDYDNIGFVCKYHDTLNTLIKKYSNLPLSFPNIQLSEIINKKNHLTIKATFNEKTQHFEIDTNDFDKYDHFILSTIQYQKLFQILITIFNEKEKKPEEKKWYFLKKTFSIINAQRENFQFNNFFDPHTIMNDIHYTRKSLTGYSMTIGKIWSILENFSEFSLNQNSTQVDNIQKKLEKSDFFNRLSSIIKKFLGKELLIEYINQSLTLSLIDQSKRPIYFDELSSGEKAILMIIFALYGNDLTNGFILINEPELHLHPQMQKELNHLFEAFTEENNTQIILSTNSPIFINENNITNVYRVYRNTQGNTEIISPKILVDYDDATLIHMLKFENLSKIFFVNKIILVEGDTDAYFFNFYLNYLKTLPEWKDKILDYEVININGKGSLHTWIRFLNKFNIKNYFIGDRDNTVEYGFFTKAELNKFYLLANQAIKKEPKEKKYNDYYNRLVKTILTFKPKKYRAIIKGIEKLYQDNIFILKQGAIESYISVEKKGLGHVAHFCNTYFPTRLHDKQFSSQRKELLEIMHHIFTKSE